MKPNNVGPCAKVTVTCTIISPDGQRFVGTNYCNNSQPVCPRRDGEGYEKCASICDQAGHAEQIATYLAGANAVGAAAYLEGHTYACQACQEVLFGAGVATLSIGIAPPLEVTTWWERVDSLTKALGRGPTLDELVQASKDHRMTCEENDAQLFINL